MDDWSFDVFQINEIGDGHALKYVGYELLQKYNLINKFKVWVSCSRLPTWYCVDITGLTKLDGSFFFIKFANCCSRYHGTHLCCTLCSVKNDTPKHFVLTSANLHWIQRNLTCVSLVTNSCEPICTKFGGDIGRSSMHTKLKKMLKILAPFPNHSGWNSNVVEQ